MTDIIFCFDTEDFTSPRSDDAILRNARLLEAHGVRGCFCLVGLVAQMLMNRNRSDVLSALKYHEIGTHSLSHSIHPTINEYTDKRDFARAYGEFILKESAAADSIKKATGAQRLAAAVPPGNSKSYVAMYGYADMGIPTYCDTFADTPDGGGVFFCNALHLEYFISLEELFFFKKHTISELLELLARRKKAIIYNHPNYILYSDFWDKVNYYKRNLVKFHGWREPPLRPSVQVESFYEGFDALLRALKSDGRFRFRTPGEIAVRQDPAAPRTVTRDMLPVIYRKLKQSFYPIEEPVSLCLSDVFLALAAFLCGSHYHRAGLVRGFLETPYAVTQSERITARALKDAALGLDVSGFLPIKIDVGGVTIGPADFIFAALECLCGCGEDIEITPRPWQINLSEFPAIRDCSLKNTWIHSDKFEDKYLSDRLRLQTWTLRT